MADEVVVGATKKSLVVRLQDENGAPINLSGGSAKLQGKSTQLASVTIDSVMTLTDPAQGECTLAQLGTLVTHAQLVAAGGAGSSATFRLRVRYVDAAAKFDFGPQFELVFRDTPTET